MTALEDGLVPGRRFRCEGCGNVTRFDVVATTRSRAFHHFDLGGDRTVEDDAVLERVVESVTCRWCNRADAIVVEAAPAADEAARQ
ncbi:MAG: hypothetical protein R3249_01665 [Nitriliruptorales bacterium]|nr:hypothetical protein [Nitriliruptorales bacterium]